MTSTRDCKRFATLAVLFVLALPITARSVSETTYHLTHPYPVAGDGAWDYIRIDSGSRRIYASHGDRVEVLDADTGKLVGQIQNTPSVHGVALAPEINRGFTSNGGDKSVTIFELQALRPIKKVTVNRPDFILYDSYSHRVFPLSQKTSVLDARTGEVVAEVDLGGIPEAAMSDGKGTIYVNLKDKSAVALVDGDSLTVKASYAIENCRSPHSLAYDDLNQRLFIGCRDGLIAMNSANGRNVGGSPMCSGVDSGAFDSDSRLIFESCGEGVISVIEQVTPDFYQLVDTVRTQLFAKTMAFDTKTKRIFLPVADFETVRDSDPVKPPEVRLKPGTFRILVLEP